MNYWYNKNKNRTVHQILFLSTLIIFLSTSCSDSYEAPDVSQLNIEMEWTRYDSLLFELDTDRVDQLFPLVKEAHPAFSDLYFDKILGLKDTATIVKDLITNKMMRILYDSVLLHYEHMDEERASFEQAFKYYKYYFPNEPIPDVYTCITEFSVASFVFLDEEGEDALGISLDMYLGEGFPYERMGPGISTFSGYLSRTFNSDHLVKKTLQALVEDKLPPLQDDRLLDQMIRNGKVLYILDKLMPGVSDTVLFEYTPAQLEWCRENEPQIWAFLIDKELLYSRNRTEISTLINPAPSSMGMPPESPGRTANFIGYRIIADYMEDLPEMDLAALIEANDAQSILTLSKYKAR